MAKFLIVDNVCTANKHLITPLIVGEIVQKINDDSVDEQYVKVYHNEGKNTSIFSKTYFKVYEPKSKLELVKLIKNKGIIPNQS